MSKLFSEDHEFEPPSAHHPSAPPHESFDISTTVDPGYVISLIRKLLPSDVKDGENATGSGSIHEEPETEGRKDYASGLLEDAGEDGKLDGPGPGNADNNQDELAGEALWEECGCILWDLAASEEHAQFMVQNLILEVLLANLNVSRSSRITEISLGIIGNLACHASCRKQLASINGLVGAIVDQLLLDDVPCLCEACRVLTLCLEGSKDVIWAKTLQVEQTLSRILWIVENALTPQLIEKSVGLLLAALESQQEVAAILLPPLFKLGLSSLLIKLVAFETSKLKGERVPERYTALDMILRAIEAISAMDEYSEEICLDKELLPLLKELIELSDKFEVGSSCVTAAVLVANILTDATNLTSELSQDPKFLQGLFDVFPFASDEPEALNAIWSIIARLLMQVQESEMSPSMLQSLVSTLASKLDLIEDELLACPFGDEEHKITGTCLEQKDSRVIAIRRVSSILTHWKSSDDRMKNTCSMEDYYVNEEDVDKLLDLCRKASR